VTESEYSHGKESISNMQKRNRRIRPEILELSSKFGIIFVTEAYNESILLQDKEMYLVEINGTYLSLFFSERGDHLTLQENIHESIS